MTDDEAKRAAAKERIPAAQTEQAEWLRRFREELAARLTLEERMRSDAHRLALAAVGMGLKVEVYDSNLLASHYIEVYGLECGRAKIRFADHELPPYGWLSRPDFEISYSEWTPAKSPSGTVDDAIAWLSKQPRKTR